MSKPALIILKIGGSVITDRNQDRPILVRSRLMRISQEISSARLPSGSRLLLIHGAGSFGHPIVRRTGIHEGIVCQEQLLAFGETQRLQTWLNACVVRYLLREGLPAFPFQPSSLAVTDKGRISSMDLTALMGLLELGMIPVLYGVPVMDTIQGCSILSGDQLLGYLGEHLDATMVLHATNVSGVFTADPIQDKQAQFLPRVILGNTDDLPPGVGGSAVTDVTGGLRKKLQEMLVAGTGGQIFDATVPGNLQRALRGQIVGTEVLLGEE